MPTQYSNLAKFRLCKYPIVLWSMGAIAIAAMFPLLLLATTPPAVDQVLLPKPTGAYAIGRTSFHLVDSSRVDDQGSRPDHKREFIVFAWYPAEPGNNSPRADWLPSAWVPLEAEGLLGMMLSRSSNPAAKHVTAVLNSIGDHAREGAPIMRSTSGPFPVLLFAPGNYMFPTEYTSVIEDIVSNGYVVFGYVPTGFVTAVSNPDGPITRPYTQLK
jgi:predicted dienelactone hydrolase